MTEGRPRVTKVVAFAPISDLDVLKFAAGLEQASEHRWPRPLSKPRVPVA